MDAFLVQVLDQPAWLIYLVTFTIVFIEDALFVGFVVPGETVAILGGVSASMGHTELGWMLVGVVIAAIVGDSVGYEVGRLWGHRVLEARILQKRQVQLNKAKDFLQRRGGSAVLLGRWTAFFRAVMPALAGWSRMQYRVFLPWNAAGGVLWGTAVVLGGYFAGMSYQTVAKWLGGGASAVVLTIVVVAVTVWHLRKRRHERAVENEARAGSAAVVSPDPAP